MYLVLCSLLRESSHLLPPTTLLKSCVLLLPWVHNVVGTVGAVCLILSDCCVGPFDACAPLRILSHSLYTETVVARVLQPIVCAVSVTECTVSAIVSTVVVIVAECIALAVVIVV